MTTPDTIAPTGQYTTTEACGILGVHRNTLLLQARQRQALLQGLRADTVREGNYLN